MSWHYYARPKAPSEPPANLEKLVQLAVPLRPRKKFIEKLAEEEKKRTGEVSEPPPVPPEEVLNRLTKLPHRYEIRKQRRDLSDKPRDYLNLRQLPPVKNAEYIEKLSKPLRVSSKHVYVRHEPPPIPKKQERTRRLSTPEEHQSQEQQVEGDAEGEMVNEQGGSEAGSHQQTGQQNDFKTGHGQSEGTSSLTNPSSSQGGVEDQERRGSNATENHHQNQSRQCVSGITNDPSQASEPNQLQQQGPEGS